MSNIKRQLTIQPPTRQEKNEKIVSEAHVCGYCYGNGFFWGDDEYGQSVKEPCPVCKGKGVVDAYITIEWKPSKTVVNKNESNN